LRKQDFQIFDSKHIGNYTHIHAQAFLLGSLATLAKRSRHFTRSGRRGPVNGLKLCDSFASPSH
jgi:hypothetical protein